MAWNGTDPRTPKKAATAPLATTTECADDLAALGKKTEQKVPELGHWTEYRFPPEKQ
jgi:hypothetical protein